jgi:hypothetical protein
VHALLEGLDFARPTLPTPARARSLARAQGWRLSAAQGQAMIALVEAFAASPLCARLAGARHVRREHPFALMLEAAPAGEPQAPGDGGGAGTGSLLTGVVDVMADEDGGSVLIVDYKTDRLDGADPVTALGDHYHVQRSVYALAALRSGARQVEVAHCFLERPADLASARFEAGDVERLEAELRSLATELGLGRFPVAAQPHRELCLTCPARRSLCSWEESMTLRPHPGSPDSPRAP